MENPGKKPSKIFLHHECRGASERAVRSFGDEQLSEKVSPPAGKNNAHIFQHPLPFWKLQHVFFVEDF